jgi:hypothetical protein
MAHKKERGILSSKNQQVGRIPYSPYLRWTAAAAPDTNRILNDDYNKGLLAFI